MVANLARPAEVVQHGDQAGDHLDTAPPGQAPCGVWSILIPPLHSPLQPVHMT
jgi:hypothetical protein